MEWEGVEARATKCGRGRNSASSCAMAGDGGLAERRPKMATMPPSPITTLTRDFETMRPDSPARLSRPNSPTEVLLQDALPQELIVTVLTHLSEDELPIVDCVGRIFHEPWPLYPTRPSLVKQVTCRTSNSPHPSRADLPLPSQALQQRTAERCEPAYTMQAHIEDAGVAQACCRRLVSVTTDFELARQA